MKPVWSGFIILSNVNFILLAIIDEKNLYMELNMLIFLIFFKQFLSLPVFGIQLHIMVPSIFKSGKLLFSKGGYTLYRLIERLSKKIKKHVYSYIH